MKRGAVKGRPVLKTPEPVAVPKPIASNSARLLWIFAAAAFLLAIWAYSPAMNGEFVFDDLHLPIMQTNARYIPLVKFLDVRPILMFTYWANLHLSGMQPFAYHAVNLFFHLVASTLLFFVVRKILELSAIANPQRNLLSALSAAVFLLHPMQTEAVSYIAQRGESMGAAFFFAAWCLFLYRKQRAVSWPVAVGILLLYWAAVATKEHTVTLPAVLLLTDYFFHPETPGWPGIRSNWRLYGPIAIGGLAGAVVIARHLAKDTTSIGFQLKDLAWYQYLFTEWRVFFVYLGLFLLPVWQSVDYDFAISRTPLDHGAVFALIAIVLLVAAAVAYRKRYPLASFGFLLFVLMLLPTSSVVPIRDVIADRRLYLPMTGLLFICAEFLRGFRHNRALIALAMVVLALGTFARNQVWASSLNVWEDAAEKSPNKQRVQFGLAVAQFRAGKCHEAVEHYRRANELEKADYAVLMNWSLAYECDHQPDLAIATMNESLRAKPSAESWASMGVLYARQGKVAEALDSLQKAQVMKPAYPMTYFYRAKILVAMRNAPEAILNLKQVLALDPSNESARLSLEQLQRETR